MTTCPDFSWWNRLAAGSALVRLGGNLVNKLLTAKHVDSRAEPIS